MAQTTPVSGATARRSRGVVLRIWGFLWNSIIRVLWLCAYATASVVLVIFVFVFNDQGQDLLRLSAEYGTPLRNTLLWNLFFLTGALILGLVLWYTSRRLLDPDFAGQSFDRPTSAFGREWWPRLFGFLVPAAIGAGFFRVAGDAGWAAWILGAAFLILAAALMWFVIQRRTLFGLTRAGLEQASPGLDTKDWILIITAFVLAVLLVAGFLTWPVTWPQALGTPAIMLFGLAGITLFGAFVLTYSFLANGQPAGTAFVLVLAVIFSLFNDNHAIRTAAEVAEHQRLTAPEHYRAWRQENPASGQIDGREPVVLVAASGGGIRAAYWTAPSLAAMEDIPGFSENLFAVSAVSGGSVGAAVYTAVKRQALERDDTAAATTLTSVRTALRQDFLSPLAAGFLFPDLLQRFVPYPFALTDRQRFLELAFERALDDGHSPLGGPFVDLWADGYQMRLPSLLLNTTVVDSGRRGILSNLDPRGLPDTLDLLGDGFSTQAILSSAAAGASARFTYLSPAGSLIGPGDQGPQKIRVVDGGYFDNSGTATITDLLELIDDRTLFPILIMIRNDPRGEAICQARYRPLTANLGSPAGPPSEDFLSEVGSPIRALLNARNARGWLTEIDSARQFEGAAARRVENDLRGAVIEISLAAAAQAGLVRAETDAARRRIEQAIAAPPLGWSLSKAATGYMDQALDDPPGELLGELDNLRAVLAGHLKDYRRCTER